MTTFVLKKYEEKKDLENKSQPTENKSEKAPEHLMITVTGSISEIVANALNKVLGKDVDIQEQDKDTESNIKAISTENINNAPLETFNSIQKDDVVFIYNNGFKTQKEEWFLTNIGNKTENVFYTLESFIRYIQKRLNLV